MTLTPNMETILVAVLGEMRRLEAFADRPPPGMDRDEWRTQWRERQDYDKFGVRHDLARWLHGEPTASNSAVFSRALRNMEAMGLVVRVTVLEKGFECEGEVYRSLSAVAQKVTGAHWSGHLFFGLAGKKGDNA